MRDFSWLAVVIIVTLVSGASADALQTNEHRPVYSHDGASVVFMRQSAETAGDWELFIAEASGANPRRLTDSPGWDGYAVFSPDGGALVFDRSLDGSDGAKQPHLLELASGRVSRLGDFDGWLSVSDWSAEHGMLAFWEKDGQRDLFLVERNGEITRQITATPDASEHDAHFSPDGTRVVFASGPAEGDGVTTLELMRLLDGERTLLVSSPGRIYGASWSPDGARIAYTDAPDGENGDVFVIELGSRAVHRLTTHPSWDHMPVWRSDGSALLFTSYRSGPERVYTLDLEDRSVAGWPRR
jgi:Tol biopolymer transport system component